MDGSAAGVRGGCVRARGFWVWRCGTADADGSRRVASRAAAICACGAVGVRGTGAARRRQADIDADVRARTLCVQLRRGVLRARCKPRARSGAELPFGGGGGLVRVPDVSTPCRFRRRQRGWPVTRTVYKPAIEIAHDSIAPFRKGGTIHCRRVNICVFVRAPLMRRKLAARGSMPSLLGTSTQLRCMHVVSPPSRRLHARVPVYWILLFIVAFPFRFSLNIIDTIHITCMTPVVS